MAAIIKLCFFMLLIISCIFSVVQGQIVTDQNWGYNAQSTSFPGPLNWLVKPYLIYQALTLLYHIQPDLTYFILFLSYFTCFCPKIFCQLLLSVYYPPLAIFTLLSVPSTVMSRLIL